MADRFTRAQVQQFRVWLREKSKPSTGREEQKKLRGKLRAAGFKISDYTSDQAGFVESDLDELIARGRIVVVDDE